MHNKIVNKKRSLAQVPFQLCSFVSMRTSRDGCAAGARNLVVEEEMRGLLCSIGWARFMLNMFAEMYEVSSIFGLCQIVGLIPKLTYHISQHVSFFFLLFRRIVNHVGFYWCSMINPPTVSSVEFVHICMMLVVVLCRNVLNLIVGFDKFGNNLVSVFWNQFDSLNYLTKFVVKI